MCVCRCSATSGVTAAVTAHDVKLFIHQFNWTSAECPCGTIGFGNFPCCSCCDHFVSFQNVTPKMPFLPVWAVKLSNLCVQAVLWNSRAKGCLVCGSQSCSCGLLCPETTFCTGQCMPGLPWAGVKQPREKAWAVRSFRRNKCFVLLTDSLLSFLLWSPVGSADGREDQDAEGAPDGQQAAPARHLPQVQEGGGTGLWQRCGEL